MRRAFVKPWVWLMLLLTFVVLLVILGEKGVTIKSRRGAGGEHNGDPLLYFEVQKKSPAMGKFDPMHKLRNIGPQDVERLKEIERNRQKLYVKMLKDRGQYVELPGGGAKVTSLVGAKAVLPSSLKAKPLSEWNDLEQIWMNLTHFPWSNDAQCDKFAIRFADPKRERPWRVALASYPGSGNTWLRYIIEAVFGVFTGSMYSDIALKREAYYGEAVPYDSGLVHVIKSHGFTTGDCVELQRDLQTKCNHMDELNRRAILLIRNPFDAIVSHRNLDEGGHKGLADERDFKGEGWRYFVSVKIGLWENFYLDWLSGTDVLVVHYESLKENITKLVRDIGDFLDLKVDPSRLQCLLKHTEGKFHRKKNAIPGEAVIKSEHYFDKDQKIVIRSAISRVNQALKQRGFAEFSYEHT